MTIRSVLLRVFVFPYSSGKRTIADKMPSHTLCSRVIYRSENDPVSTTRPRSAELSYYYYVLGDSSVYVCLHSILNVYFLNKTVIVINKLRTNLSTSKSGPPVTMIISIIFYAHLFYTLNFKTILYLQLI